MSVESQEIGSFIDSVAGTFRTPSAVAGRLLEETVELALDAGLTAGEIMAHIADALHNQALKASAAAGKTVFPSQVSGKSKGLGQECADVSLVLKDLCHVAKVDLPAEERAKFEVFKTKVFWVSPQGTVYAVKGHIQT